MLCGATAVLHLSSTVSRRDANQSLEKPAMAGAAVAARPLIRVGDRGRSVIDHQADQQRRQPALFGQQPRHHLRGGAVEHQQPQAAVDLALSE
jgi:2-succinyl-5-enolpyruvyl-6-hydroxy-3-cyclohexene-1-carboxylate synthase